jgi:integrase
MLTDARVRALRVGRASDGRGLYVIVLPSGTKSWRYDFRWPKKADGKRQTLCLGQYPEITLAEARERHLEARKALDQGKNPAHLKQRSKIELAQRGTDTFKAIAEDWYNSREAHRSQSWRSNYRRWLDEIVYPAVGALPLTEVQPAHVLALLKQVSHIPASAEIIRRMMAMIFDYGILQLRAPTGFNPARALRGAVVAPAPVNNPWLKRTEIPTFLKKIDYCDSSRTIQLAIWLLAHTFVRKMELLNAKWSEIDMDRAEWLIPAERMKGGQVHLVPLSSQVVTMLCELKGLAGSSEFVFPVQRSSRTPLSHSVLNKVFYRMGYANKLTPHGLRATASSALNEAGWRPDVIEKQLSHIEGNTVRRSYNHTDYLPERRKMMQSWSDTLDILAAGTSNVTPIKAAA